MRRETLIDGVTAGVTTNRFSVQHRQPLTLAASGLAGSENCKLQILVNGAFTDVYDPASASLVEMTAAGNVVAVPIPGIYRLVLSVTGSAVSVDRYTSGV